MFEMSKIRKHFTEPVNLIIYALFIYWFAYGVINNGWEISIKKAFTLVYVFVGIQMIIDFAISIKYIEYELTYIKLLSYIYVIIYLAIQIISDKVQISLLLIPVLVGVVLSIPELFRTAKCFRKIYIVEYKISKKIKNVFK